MATGGFENIKRALEYIDDHLDEPISYESLAKHFHFSPYYFHRLFSLIAGKTITAHIRDRRLARACALLSATKTSVLDVALDCGFNSAQSFARAFNAAYGLPPSEYRARGLVPDAATVDEMIMRFTNRLRGGIYLNPKIIKRSTMVIAGVSGDGNKTGEVWEKFMRLAGETPPANKISENGYEIRVYDGDSCDVHVGYEVKGEAVGCGYEAIKLPASEYASFDVYVANGYESENSAMDEWLRTNEKGYAERLYDEAGKRYCVEYYDERFRGDEAGSIVEIWVPVKK